MFSQCQQNRFFSFFLILIALQFSYGCSTQHVVQSENDAHLLAGTDEAEAEADPYEGFNRAMFGFNEAIDTFIADPITSAYVFILPNFVLAGVSNFYSNLNGFNVILNDVLQAKFEQGLSDTGRLALNSTVGLAGLIDVATYAGLEQHDEDFEQTLAIWGVPSGPYLVLPFVGPGTVRGLPASVVDAAGHPITYLPIAFAAVGALNRRANAEGALNFIDEAALDPYVFTRESYLQFREHQIRDGKGDIADQLSDFDEALFDEELFDDPELYDDLDSSQEQTIAAEKKILDEQMIPNESISEPVLLKGVAEEEQKSNTPSVNESTDSIEVERDNQIDIDTKATRDSLPTAANKDVQITN